MIYTFDGFNWFMRLDKGERLSEAFKAFFAETKCNGAWINGIGGALEAELGLYDLEKKSYQWRTFKGFYEVTSLQGTVALAENNQSMFHLHGVISDQNYQTCGGHVKDLVVAATLELFIHRSQQPLKRKTNHEVGLRLLEL